MSDRKQLVIVRLALSLTAGIIAASLIALSTRKSPVSPHDQTQVALARIYRTTTYYADTFSITNAGGKAPSIRGSLLFHRKPLILIVTHVDVESGQEVSTCFHEKQDGGLSFVQFWKPRFIVLYGNANSGLAKLRSALGEYVTLVVEPLMAIDTTDSKFDGIQSRWRISELGSDILRSGSVKLDEGGYISRVSLKAGGTLLVHRLSE